MILLYICTSRSCIESSDTRHACQPSGQRSMEHNGSATRLLASLSFRHCLIIMSSGCSLMAHARALRLSVISPLVSLGARRRFRDPEPPRRPHFGESSRKKPYCKLGWYGQLDTSQGAKQAREGRTDLEHANEACYMRSRTKTSTATQDGRLWGRVQKAVDGRDHVKPHPASWMLENGALKTFLQARSKHGTQLSSV